MHQSFPNSEQLNIMRGVLKSKPISEIANETGITIKEALTQFNTGMEITGLKDLNDLFLWELRLPLLEMPQITKKGKDVYADDKLLKTLQVKAVINNLVFIREPNKGGFIPEGWSLVYFMDSEESAKAMASGDLPYLLVPVGTFHGGGSPILDVWKKRFQQPGHEHILGILQGNTTDSAIFVDMLTVRPGYHRNTIATKMVDLIRQEYPNAEFHHSSPTDKGRAFLKKKQLLEPRFQTPYDLDEGYHDRARLEAFYHEATSGYVFWFFRNGRPAGEIQMISKDGRMLGFGVQRSLQNTGLGKAMLKYAFEKTGLDKLTFGSTSNAFYHKVGSEREKGSQGQFTLKRDKLKATSLTFKDIDKDTAMKYIMQDPIDPWYGRTDRGY